jgi:hypothetical protein
MVTSMRTHRSAVVTAAALIVGTLFLVAIVVVPPTIQIKVSMQSVFSMVGPLLLQNLTSIFHMHALCI